MLAQVELTPVAPSTEKEKPTSSAPAVPLPRTRGRLKGRIRSVGDFCSGSTRARSRSQAVTATSATKGQ